MSDVSLNLFKNKSNSSKYNCCKNKCDMDEVEAAEMEEPEEMCCVTDPDLLLLRRTAIGERQAIAFYLDAAERTTGTLRDLFTHIAHDEMVHFRNTMSVIAMLDPTQAHEFEDQDIVLMSMLTRKYTPQANYNNSQKCGNMESIKLLTDAIADELEAINLYQVSYTEACNKIAKRLFCNNMNDEKEHLAELWKALMDYTGEDTITMED